jgi:hypothetical protein
VFLSGRKRDRIKIAVDENGTIAEYASTLLHELLHFWLHVMAMRGWVVKDEPEHRFIYAVEKSVLRQLKYLRRGRRKHVTSRACTSN